MASYRDDLPAASPPIPEKLIASCHCGRVKLQLPSAPSKVNECRCSACYRYGAVWAYYPSSEVLITAEEPSTRAYVREDEGATGSIGFYSCAHCGCMTHWSVQPGHGEDGEDGDKVGVNARMLPESMLEGVARNLTWAEVKAKRFA